MVLYLQVGGGEEITASDLDAVAASRAATTWWYFVSSAVIPRSANWASVWANHADGQVVQNVGSLSATVSIDMMRVVACDLDLDMDLF